MPVCEKCGGLYPQKSTHKRQIKSCWLRQIPVELFADLFVLKLLLERQDSLTGAFVHNMRNKNRVGVYREAHVSRTLNATQLDAGQFA